MKPIQLEEIDAELRNGIWNSLIIFFFDAIEKNYKHSVESEFDFFCKILWLKFFKLPIDLIPNNEFEKKSYLRKRFFQFAWFEVFDFIEYIYNLNNNNNNRFNIDFYSFKELCNTILEQENSAYRFIDNQIAPITNETEIDEIESAIITAGGFSALNGVNIHLKTALDKIAAKKNPDYRNSIKESISAVESLAKIISGNNKDSLSGALDKIKGKTKIHPALEKGFKQIYGYTSDGDGIRHALTDETTCDFEDAKFMLVSCSAFINYLISKSSKVGIKFNK